mmetsp:Transcript_18980/g.52722  ORF Transcript_18980/g.52722 Transcript_18980/m.52722 type:complete len:348 (+) Transcript_18980:517-1560(+)
MEDRGPVVVIVDVTSMMVAGPRPRCTVRRGRIPKLVEKLEGIRGLVTCMLNGSLDVMGSIVQNSCRQHGHLGSSFLANQGMMQSLWNACWHSTFFEKQTTSSISYEDKQMAHPPRTSRFPLGEMSGNRSTASSKSLSMGMSSVSVSSVTVVTAGAAGTAAAVLTDVAVSPVSMSSAFAALAAAVSAVTSTMSSGFVSTSSTSSLAATFLSSSSAACVAVASSLGSVGVTVAVAAAGCGTEEDELVSPSSLFAMCSALTSCAHEGMVHDGWWMVEHQRKSARECIEKHRTVHQASTWGRADKRKAEEGKEARSMCAVPWCWKEVFGYSQRFGKMDATKRTKEGEVPCS